MSLFAGTCTMNEGTQFVNVIGSTNDPPVTENSLNPENPSISRVDWLTLWSGQCNGGKKDVLCIACGERPAKVGGHVVLRGTGNDATRYARRLKGSNRVFIVPICEVCNGQDLYFGREKVFSAKREIEIVQLWAFGEDCELDEAKFVSKDWRLLDLSAVKLKKILSAARNKYKEDLEQRREDECVLDSADETALSTAPPALPSDPSRASSSTGPSWRSPVAPPAGSSRRSPVALPSDLSQESSDIYYDSGSEFLPDPDEQYDSDFL